ncbi:MAG: MFS transporter, partial [Nitrososphaeria archaeon]
MEQRERVTRAHWLISTLAAMGVFLDGYDLNVIAFSILLISSVYGIRTSSVYYPLLLSSGLIGMAIGGVLFGFFADRIGRKSMFVIDIAMFVVFTALSALARSVAEIIIFRVLMGIGIGADYPVSSALIAEMSPTARRGMLLMYGIMFYWLGVLVSGVVNYLALPLGPDMAWRVALGFGAALAVPVIAARWLMPESFRWLKARGRDEEAERVASSVMGQGYVVDPQRRVSAGQLLREYRWPLLFVLFTWFSFALGSYGFGFFTPTLYHELGIRSLRTIVLFGIITAPFPIISYLALMRISDGLGRRIPTVVGFAAMVLVLLLLVPLVRISPYMLLPLFIVYVSLEQWPGGLLSFAYSVELFPTSVRGFAQGLATSVSRIGAIVGIFAFDYLKGLGLIYGTL